LQVFSILLKLRNKRNNTKKNLPIIQKFMKKLKTRSIDNKLKKIK